MTDKNLLLTSFLLFTLNSCNLKNNSPQTDFGKVQISNERFERFANQNKYFACNKPKGKISDKPMSTYAEIILKKNQLTIKNTDNTYFEDCRIYISIDSSMKILHIDYNKLSDAVTDCEIRYEVIESSVNLNKNPFSGQKQKLVGNYYLKIKEITDYNWFWKKDKVDIFSFKGRFECGKNMWLP